jgi:hypothetical protein
MADKIITIFSDASLRGNRSGWAAWAKCDGRTMRISAGITWPVSNIAEAETVALTMAILKAVEEFKPSPGTVIVAQSDSCDALGALRWASNFAASAPPVLVAKGTDAIPGVPKTLNGERAAFAQRAIKVALDAKVLIYVKHVRAHTGKADPRSSVNEWCDRQAKVEAGRVVIYPNASAPRRQLF